MTTIHVTVFCKIYIEKIENKRIKRQKKINYINVFFTFIVTFYNFVSTKYLSKKTWKVNRRATFTYVNIKLNMLALMERTVK